MMSLGRGQRVVARPDVRNMNSARHVCDYQTASRGGQQSVAMVYDGSYDAGQVVR
jgi:hypothetical protein